MISINSHTINKNSTIRHALEKLTAIGENLTLFIVDDFEILLGVITDGDIRRGFIKGFTIDDGRQLFTGIVLSASAYLIKNVMSKRK